MNLILHIDTAVQGASVCLSNGEQIIATQTSPLQKESASWLHQSIQDVLAQNNFRPDQLSAIAISIGPGSYTGLRVGLSAAKGLCYALSVPLIEVSTLQMMAASVKECTSTDLLCPMIDARRMEVFTALYDTTLQTVVPPTNMILDESSFQEKLQNNTITFFGNGSAKTKSIIQHSNAFFVDHITTAKDMVSLALKKFEENQFLELAYSEPYYGKDFHSPISKKIY